MDRENSDKIREEIFHLRKLSAINNQIGEFVSEIYDLQSVSEVFESLRKYLYELTTFDKSVYLTLLLDSAELKVDFTQGFTLEETPNFSFDIFEVPDKNIISAVFERKTSVISNGINDINDLSIRLDMDNYALVPMILRSEKEKSSSEVAAENLSAAQNEDGEENPFAKEREKLKYLRFSVAGVFVFDCGVKMNKSERNDNISLAEKIIKLAGTKINNLLVLEDLRRTSEINKKELEAARQVQEKLLPEKLPFNDVLQTAAFYVPVNEIGGDYYDLFQLKEGVFAVLIADVSGHGASAALIMSAAKILFKTIASADLSPSQTLKRLNEELINHIPTNRFLTTFYAIIDTNRRKIDYTSAGHCPIVLFNKRSKEYVQFQSNGFPVGISPDLQLPNHEYYYHKGDNRLCLYTDGVVDCFNKERMQFGLVRLKSIIAKTLELPSYKVVNEVWDNVKKFTGNRKSEDDLTLFVVDF